MSFVPWKFWEAVRCYAIVGQSLYRVLGPSYLGPLVSYVNTDRSVM